ncbi:MAG: putative addiction module antidote protein [Rickettsiales bacterium]|jgi:probable addiction module antidote protein|nr:putative addiction module antidote protein [Rickettsiales bacterium]
MTKEKTTRWRAWDYLNSEEDIAEYLKVSLAEDNLGDLINSIRVIIRSKGFSKIAKKTGINRESLYKSFSGNTKPRFETVYKAINGLGFRFDIIPINNLKKSLA